MFENRKLLKDIFIADEKCDNYIVFEHKQKVWIMPERGLNVGLDMYQPTTVKGKLLKKIVEKNSKIEFLNKFLNIYKINVQINEQIQQYITDVVKEENYYIAGYMGDISSEDNNKITLQIYTDTKNICYVKITKKENVRELFEREKNTLDVLKDKGINNIPQVLGETEIEGMRIIIQSTKKKLGEEARLVFDKRHVEFVYKLVQKTKKIMPYEDTDFYKNICYIKSQNMHNASKEILLQATRIIEKGIEDEAIEFAFSHGDYTLWNMYYDGEELQVFDFEYSSYSKPCYIDVFHYITQMSLLGKRNKAKDTITLYESERVLLSQYIKNPEIIYLCYLLDIISFYDKRTTGINDILNKEYDQWIIIMKYLIEKIEGIKA